MLRALVALVACMFLKIVPNLGTSDKKTSRFEQL